MGVAVIRFNLLPNGYVSAASCCLLSLFPEDSTMSPRQRANSIHTNKKVLRVMGFSRRFGFLVIHWRVSSLSWHEPAWLAMAQKGWCGRTNYKDHGAIQSAMRVKYLALLLRNYQLIRFISSAWKHAYMDVCMDVCR